MPYIPLVKYGSILRSMWYRSETAPCGILCNGKKDSLLFDNDIIQETLKAVLKLLLTIQLK